MSADELVTDVPQGYRWWQWVLGFFFLPVLILMIVGVSNQRLRPKLSYGRIWAYCSVPMFLFLVCTVGVSILAEEPAAVPVRVSSSTLSPAEANATHTARRIARATPRGERPRQSVPPPTAVPANPIFKMGPCRYETPETEAWFAEYFRQYTQMKALFEGIADDLDPNGSYFHYGTIAEVKDAVDFRAERMMELAGDMSASDPPSNVPIRVKRQKDHLAAAYDEFARLIFYKFDGDILGTSVAQGELARAVQKFIDSETHSHPIILRVANSDVNCREL